MYKLLSVTTVRLYLYSNYNMLSLTTIWKLYINDSHDVSCTIIFCEQAICLYPNAPIRRNNHRCITRVYDSVTTKWFICNCAYPVCTLDLNLVNSYSSFYWSKHPALISRLWVTLRTVLVHGYSELILINPIGNVVILKLILHFVILRTPWEFVLIWKPHISTDDVITLFR